MTGVQTCALPISILLSTRTGWQTMLVLGAFLKLLPDDLHHLMATDCVLPQVALWGKGMNKTRPKQLSFRVNEEEYQKLQERVQESGKNQQEYILSCVLDKKIVNTDGIKELIPELKRIGNNLNQIAKRCNEGGVLPSEAEVREQGEELKQVWQLLRRYLQRQA